MIIVSFRISLSSFSTSFPSWKGNFSYWFPAHRCTSSVFRFSAHRKEQRRAWRCTRHLSRLPAMINTWGDALICFFGPIFQLPTNGISYSINFPAKIEPVYATMFFCFCTNWIILISLIKSQVLVWILSFVYRVPRSNCICKKSFFKGFFGGYTNSIFVLTFCSLKLILKYLKCWNSESILLVSQ